MPATPIDQLNVIASIAPSAAPVETPSVNGVASGLRSSPWKTTPAAANSAPTAAPGQRPRQPRDEEDLRVGVVGEGDREVEGPAEVHGRGPDQRRDQQRGEQQRAEPKCRPCERAVAASRRGYPDRVNRHDDALAGRAAG